MGKIWWKIVLFGVVVMCLLIEIQARHIKKWSNTKKGLRNIKSHKNQSTVSKREDLTGELEIDGNKFQSIGCFRDAWNRVIPALEGEHQLLMEPNYKARKYALLKCARAAADKQLKLFGIENGGQCFGADDEKSIDKYGMAVECKGDGKGGPWSLQAYKFENLATDGAFTDWSAWTTCSKTCGHGVRRRMRTCTNPPPSNSGKDCSELGPSVEGEICKDKECPTVLVDEAESDNSAQPTVTTTQRNTAVPVAATYRPTIPSLKKQKSKHKEKLQIEKAEAKPTNQNDASQGSNKTKSQDTKHSGKEGTTESSPTSKVSPEEPTKVPSVDKPLDSHKDPHGYPTASQSQDTRSDAHAQTSTSFHQINEPEDQKVTSSMEKTENIKSHEQMNEHHIPPGIDPSIVEDTYNGGPVVPTSAVQFNTPLGPMVKGEVSPLSNTFNPTDQQNDEPPSDDCFCPKKVCSARADIGFLVDGSSDIPQIYFAHVLDFIKALARGFDPRDTQVSLVAYGDDAATVFGFSPLNNVNEVDDSIDAVSYMGGDPRTGNALVKVKDGIFKMYSRKDAAHALVLLTSGSSADDTNLAAAELRNTGVKVTTVGLGKLANVKELIDISSEPKSSHVFTAFLDTLPDLMDDIVKGVCSDVKGNLTDRSDKCSCEAKKDPNQDAMHQPSLEEPETGLDSSQKLPGNENSQEMSHEPSDKSSEQQSGQVKQESGASSKPDNSKSSPVFTSSGNETNHRKLDQLNMTLKAEKQDEQKPPKQQLLESVSKMKEASQGSHISISNQKTSETDTKPQESAKQGTDTLSSSQQSPETSTKPNETNKQGTHTLTSSQQSPETDTKPEDPNKQGIHTSTSSQQSPETNTRPDVINKQGTHTLTSTQQSPETNTKPEDLNKQGTHTLSSNQQSPETGTKPDETSKQGTHTLSPSQQSSETDTNHKESSSTSSQQSLQSESKEKQNKEGSSISENVFTYPKLARNGTGDDQSNATTTSQQSPEDSLPGLKTDSKVEPPDPQHNKNEKGVPKEDEKGSNNVASISYIKPLNMSRKIQNSPETAPEQLPQQGQEKVIKIGDPNLKSQPITKVHEPSDATNTILQSNKPQDKQIQSIKSTSASGNKDTSKPGAQQNSVEKLTNEQEAHNLTQNVPLEPSNSSSNNITEQILVATESSSLPLPLNTTKLQSHEPGQLLQEEIKPEHSESKINLSKQAGTGDDTLSSSTDRPKLTGTSHSNGHNAGQEKNQQAIPIQYGQNINEPQQPVAQEPSQSLNPEQANMNSNETASQENSGQLYSQAGPGEYTDQQPPQPLDQNSMNEGNNQPESQDCSVNLGVVLDSKTTAYGDDNNAQKLLRFAKRLTHIFPVSPEGNRVGMMVYSGSPKLKVVHFDHFLDQNTMDKAIDSASYLNMEIKTGRVLSFAQEHLFSRIPSGKQNVLLLITDGVSYDDVTRPALELKRRGVEIFVVGVGSNVVRNELESIASDSADDHVIMTSYDFSDALLEDIKYRICSSAQRKGGVCSACHQTTKHLYRMNILHDELTKKEHIESLNEAYLPRRRGHLYHVLSEIARK